MTFPESFFSSSQNNIVSTTKDNQAAPVGAGATSDNIDQYYYHDKFIRWIHDTKRKLPQGNPQIRKLAFIGDPLIKGTIFPFLKNTLLKGMKVQTKDNQLYSEAITEMSTYLKTIKLMEVFRDDFLDLHFLTGTSYRRIDPDIDGNISRLEKIEPNSVTAYTDPWVSSIVAYHQHASVKTSWSDIGTIEVVDSWFIPYTGSIKNINDTYIDGRPFGNSTAALYIFNGLKDKYNIIDIQNLRIAASERIIAMTQGINFRHIEYDSDEFDYNYNDSCNSIYAPIDSVLIDIFLKKLLLVNSPNVIFAVLSPFLHAKYGIMKDGKDNLGNTKIMSSIPDRPVTSDPEYAFKNQRYNDFLDSFRKLSDNVMKNFKEGGVITTGPDIDLKPIESTRSVTHQFIKGLIDQLDDEICYNFGLPKAMISASGAELATSRTVAQTYNSMHAGERTDYESVANNLVAKQFTGKVWTVKTTENDGKGNENEIIRTVTFEEMETRIELEIIDTKNLLEEAQTINLNTDSLGKLKTAGAGKEDLIAIGEEMGFGLLALDGQPIQPIQPVQPVQVPGTVPPVADDPQVDAMLPLLKSLVSQVMMDQGLISASPTDPSGFEEQEIVDRLQEAYQTAKDTMGALFEEGVHE